jgi:hypothetical protein
VLAGLTGVLSAIFLARREDARRRQLVAVSEVTRDWQPTSKINAVTDAWVMEHQKDDIPSNFVLRIEAVTLYLTDTLVGALGDSMP